MHLSGPPMSMDFRVSTIDCSLYSKVARQQALIATMRGEFRRASYRGLYPFCARELTIDSTDEQLIGYPRDQPARMQ